MKDRWQDGLTALSRFSEIEWFGISAESHSVYGYLQVPRMKWRFKDRSEHTEFSYPVGSSLKLKDSRALPTRM